MYNIFYAVNELEMGMHSQLQHFSVITKRTQAGNGCWNIYCLVHIWFVYTESKIKNLTVVIHMATPTITPTDYTNQTREISSAIC